MSALERGHAAALRRMTSTATGFLPGSRADPDPVSGLAARLWEQVYDGPCRLGGANRGTAASRAERPPGGDREVAGRTLHLPHDTEGVRDGAVFQIVSGELAGTWWQVAESTTADQQTALRLPVVQVDRPEEWPL